MSVFEWRPILWSVTLSLTYGDYVSSEDTTRAEEMDLSEEAPPWVTGAILESVTVFSLHSLSNVPRRMHMTDYFLNDPYQKFPVPRITKQTKSHSLNFNVLSSVIDSSGEEVWVSFDSDNYFYVKTWFE